MFEVEQRYEIREIIGQGAYGVVCSALDMKNNTLVAIKKIENVFDHRSLAKRTLRELKLCRYFQHENVSTQRSTQAHTEAGWHDDVERGQWKRETERESAPHTREREGKRSMGTREDGERVEMKT